MSMQQHLSMFMYITLILLLNSCNDSNFKTKSQPIIKPEQPVICCHDPIKPNHDDEQPLLSSSSCTIIVSPYPVYSNEPFTLTLKVSNPYDSVFLNNESVKLNEKNEYMITQQITQKTTYTAKVLYKNVENECTLTVDVKSSIVETNSNVPNYTQCLQINNGIVGFPAKCPQNTANVIINDGAQRYARQMTCCPISSSLLSQNPAEHYVVRYGQCGLDEIQTGIAANTDTIQVYCSKINTNLYNVVQTTTSIRVTSSTAIDLAITQAIYKLVNDGYNLNDACACPNGYFMAGGHTWTDDKCTDVCVKIETKP